MNHDKIIHELAINLGLAVSFHSRVNIELLAKRINELLIEDFQKLISVLYRMDINESKLRKLLHQNQETDAGLIIAKLMIERELQKIKSRRDLKNDDVPDVDEKW